MTDDQLTVTTDKVDDRVTVLIVTGELDRDSAPVLGAAVGAALNSGATLLVLDLGALTFCDSSGLQLFVELHKRTSLRLARVRPPVATVIEVVNLHRMLELRPTVADAVG